MDDQQQVKPGEDLEVRVTDLDPARRSNERARPSVAHSPFGPRLTRAKRATRLLTAVSALLLASLVLLGSFPSIRDSVAQLAESFLPEAVGTLGPGGDLFYFVPDVPWGTVLVDGQALTRVPTLDTGHPLRLALGRHHLEWRAAPFESVRCDLSVPHSTRDTCPVADRLFLPSCCSVVRQRLVGSLIEMHQSLATLPAAQHTALVAALQHALDASQSSAIMAPGEHYYFALPGQIGQSVTTTQELTATLSFGLITDETRPEPCDVYNPKVQPCHFVGQICQVLCTVLPQDVARDAAGGGEPTWFAAALVRPYWAYTSPAGTVIAQDVPEFGLGLGLIVLRIRWDGLTWHATAVMGHNTGVAISDDTLCAPARSWLYQGPLSYVFDTSNPDDAPQYASSATAAGGCVVVVSHYYQPNAQTVAPGPPALFLERFGLLLAANDVAHALWPQAPRADAAELGLALQLARQLGTSGVTSSPQLIR
ncbi:MAG: hypothetical protein PVSMB4_09320 [Ktedonobacterales bacterium]